VWRRNALADTGRNQLARRNAGIGFRFKGIQCHASIHIRYTIYRATQLHVGSRVLSTTAWRPAPEHTSLEIFHGLIALSSKGPVLLYPLMPLIPQMSLYLSWQLSHSAALIIRHCLSGLHWRIHHKQPTSANGLVNRPTNGPTRKQQHGCIFCVRYTDVVASSCNRPTSARPIVSPPVTLTDPSSTTTIVA
jgi:hypothetical protein